MRPGQDVPEEKVEKSIFTDIHFGQSQRTKNQRKIPG